jgi:phenylalanyl-tRNA synthetase beta chain
VGVLAPGQRLRRRLEDALRGAGLSEAVGWSFTARETAEKLGLIGEDAVVLENPMSEEQAVMRMTLLGSLLDSLRRNASRGMEDVRLFEVGAVYFSGAATGPTGNPWYPEPDPALPAERTHVGALLTGHLRPPSWSDPEPPRADFFAAKGVLEALLNALRIPFHVKRSDAEPFLHPGRAARVVVRRGDEELTAGWLGELHPAVAARWDLEAAVAGFELDLGVLIAAAPPDERYEDLTSFPGITQDLAVVVADDVPAARVIEVVRAAGGPLLAGAQVFDVYRGAQVGEGRASLAVRLEFRAADRTLTDDEVAARREKIVAALGAQVGGELRG